MARQTKNQQTAEKKTETDVVNQDKSEGHAPDEQPPKSSKSRKPTQRPKVFAGECPNNPKHLQTKVYKTLGRRRYCKCNECGATWTLTGEFADELREYASSIASSLEEASRVDDGNGTPVIVIEAALADEIATEIHRLLEK